MKRRIAALWIADFPVWARREASDCADPRRQPIVIGGIPPERGTVTALSEAARRLGLRVGMTLTQAQAIAPEACFLRPDDALIRRQLVALTELLHTLAPKVERAATDGLFYLDLRGLERLYASETELARQLRATVMEHVYPAAVGIASTKPVAAIAAREAERRDAIASRATEDPERVLIVAPGDEARFLAPLPIERLPLDARLRDDLVALGLTTIGAWAALPTAAIATRFGAHGRALHDLARGIVDEPFEPTHDARDLAVTRTLDEPLNDDGLLAFHLKRAVEILCVRLTGRALKTTSLHLELALDDHSRATRKARFTRPTDSPRLLLDCLRIDLQREQLRAPVVGFTLRATETTRAHAEQPSLFATNRADDDPAALEQALARIRAMVGDSGVVSPRLGDTHRPEEQLRWEPWKGFEPSSSRGPKRSKRKAPSEPASRLPRASSDADEPPGPALCCLPARMVQPPQLIDVRTSHAQPVFFICEYQRGPILDADGPHRIDGEWWGKHFQRDYYTIRLKEGSYWIFREQQKWYLQGVFD